MMASGAQDPSLVGRPVVFVKPPQYLVDEVLPELLKAEYAVSVLADHEQVQTLARLHPHAIVYINLDEGYYEPMWEDLIRELKDNPVTSDVRVGVLSNHQDTEMSHKYLLDLEVPCGFLKLSAPTPELTASILRVLDANEAKGRRQYLRVPGLPGSASLNLMVDNKVLAGELVDISSVGLSCWFEKDPQLVARSLVKNIQLKLKGLLCQVSAIVMGTRPREGQPPLYVFLFDPRTPEAVKDKIRVYQRKTLQQELELELERAIQADQA